MSVELDPKDWCNRRKMESAWTAVFAAAAVVVAEFAVSGAADVAAAGRVARNASPLTWQESGAAD